MSHATWVIADTHFGHANIINFKREDGSPLRPFKTIEEHDEIMIARWNEVVKPYDRVYHLGDFCINRKSMSVGLRLNGKKRLVRGNHDVFKTAEYLEIGFEEIYGVKVFPKQDLILSHIPLHPDSLNSRDWTNIHGHLHAGTVKTLAGHPDTRYCCVSVEHTDYRPVNLYMIS